MTQENKPNSVANLNGTDKDILISKMLECPGQLSDSEITQILEDDELCEIYSIFVDLKAGKKKQIPLNAKEEWLKFEPLMQKSDKVLSDKNKSDKKEKPTKNELVGQTNRTENSIATEESKVNTKPRFWNFLNPKSISRVAAIFIGALLMVGAIQMVNNNPTKSIHEDLIAQVNKTQTTEELSSNSSEGRAYNPTNQGKNIPDLTDIKEGKEITETISSEENTAFAQEKEVHKVSHPSSPKKKALMPNNAKQQTTQSFIAENITTQSHIAENITTQNHIAENSNDIGIEEYLRIQNARMENDLAMQRAEAVINQYYPMTQISGEDHSLIMTILKDGDVYTMDDEILSLVLP